MDKDVDSGMLVRWITRIELPSGVTYKTRPGFIDVYVGANLVAYMSLDWTKPVKYSRYVARDQQASRKVSELMAYLTARCREMDAAAGEKVVAEILRDLPAVEIKENEK